MKSAEQRVTALEWLQARVCRWVWRRADETDAEARARAGVGPDEDIIIFSWSEPHANT